MTVAGQRDSLEEFGEAELGDLVRAAVSELSKRGTPGAFGVLIDLSGYVGGSLGEAARRVAERGSWSEVAHISGTSKQAAWSRWRTP